MSEPSPSPDSKPGPTLPRNVVVLGFSSLLNDIASEMIYPLLPGFLLAVLGGDKFWLGVIEGAADTVASVLKLWSGAVSDRPGRRKIFVVIGYLLAVLSRPLTALIGVPWQLFAIRITDRFGKGVRTAPRDAMIADSADPSIRGRAFGFHRAMDHVGAAIGPLLAAGLLWLLPGDMRLIFGLTLMPGLAVVLLVVFGLKEPRSESDPSERATRGGEIPHRPEQKSASFYPFDRSFTTYLIALIVFTLGNSSDAFLLVRAGEIGVPTIWLPILWCAFHVIKSIGNVVMGRAIDRYGPKPFLFVGWSIYAVVYLAFSQAAAAWEVWLLFAGYALFYACSEPAEKTMVALLVGSERKGLAYGWYNFGIGVATLPASILFGALYQDFGAVAAFGTSAALACVSAFLLMLVKTPASRSPATPAA